MRTTFVMIGMLVLMAAALGGTFLLMEPAGQDMRGASYGPFSGELHLCPEDDPTCTGGTGGPGGGGQDP